MRYNTPRYDTPLQTPPMNRLILAMPTNILHPYAFVCRVVASTCFMYTYLRPHMHAKNPAICTYHAPRHYSGFNSIQYKPAQLSSAHLDNKVQQNQSSDRATHVGVS
jgi:hypothetical protein